jgi:uncharacterized glyoxalase superfamily protein PhnB
LDIEETIEQMHPGWAPSHAGSRLALAVRFDTPEQVDAMARMVRSAGHPVPLPPYDAPWGERYATVSDPDGVWVDLSAPLDRR